MRKTVLKIALFILCLCPGIISVLAQNTLLEKRIGITLHAVPMEQAIEKIAKTAGVHVSYSSDLFSACTPVTFEARDQLLLTILNTLFVPYKITYTAHAGQLIFYPKKTLVIKEHTIKGTICNEATQEPISYATLQIKGKNKGVVADHTGFFELTLTDMELSDSLSASCIGYERRTLTPESLLRTSEVILTLREKPVDIAPVVITADRHSLKKKTLGNRSWFTTGSVYLDTHGQQIALYINNKKHTNGYIRKVSYYLLDKGNVEAPFRVRVFDVDTLNQAPGKDLIPEILVVQPPEDTNGWFDVDLSEYKIYVPSTGFFVAIQGVFPNDYSFYASNSELVENGKRPARNNDDFAPRSVHYGQRVGYSGKGGSNTWHYSLSHQWFQLERDNYSVKISAEIGMYSRK